MPPAGSDMAAVVFKDPYRLDCLDTADPHREWEVEQALIDHIQRSERFLGQHRSRERPVRFPIIVTESPQERNRCLKPCGHARHLTDGNMR